jgi:hypothetical protein
MHDQVQNKDCSVALLPDARSVVQSLASLFVVNLSSRLVRNCHQHISIAVTELLRLVCNFVLMVNV